MMAATSILFKAPLVNYGDIVTQSRQVLIDSVSPGVRLVRRLFVQVPQCSQLVDILVVFLFFFPVFGVFKHPRAK